LNLHKARVRRHHGQLRFHGSIERARTSLLGSTLPRDKALTSLGSNRQSDKADHISGLPILAAENLADAAQKVVAAVKEAA